MQTIATRKPLSTGRKVLIGLGAILALLVVAVSFAHFSWKRSGDSQWRLEKEVDGIKVYSMKAPGTVLKQYKVIGQFKAKLGPIMKVMRDPDACDDVGCYESRILETVDYPRFVYYTFRYPYPSPFKPREYVVLSEFRQDPATKEIYVDYQYVPDKLPANDCCVRVTHMHNKWRFIPQADGNVQVEFIMNHNPGGFMPYFLVNSEMSNSIHTNIPDLQAVLDKDEYKFAKVDYVMEVDADVSAVENPGEKQISVSPDPL